MKHKRDEEKIEKEKTSGKQKAWEKSVPSHKVIQQGKHIEHTLENMLLVEQPSLTSCKGTLASISKKEESLKEACIDKDEVNYHQVVHKNTCISTFEVICGLNHLSPCTALVVGSDDVASSYSVDVLTRRQVGRRERSRGAREVASY